jgi:hypothetical protein
MPCDGVREIECRLPDLPYDPVKDFAFVGAIVERRGVEQVVYRVRPLNTYDETLRIWPDMAGARARTHYWRRCGLWIPAANAAKPHDPSQRQQPWWVEDQLLSRASAAPSPSHQPCVQAQRRAASQASIARIRSAAS